MSVASRRRVALKACMSEANTCNMIDCSFVSELQNTEGLPGGAELHLDIPSCDLILYGHAYD